MEQVQAEQQQKQQEKMLTNEEMIKELVEKAGDSTKLDITMTSNTNGQMVFTTKLPVGHLIEGKFVETSARKVYLPIGMDFNSKVIDYNYFIINELMIISSWCFFNGYKNQTNEEINNCKNHHTCRVAREEISSFSNVLSYIYHAINHLKQFSGNKKRKLDLTQDTTFKKPLLYIPITNKTVIHKGLFLLNDDTNTYLVLGDRQTLLANTKIVTHFGGLYPNPTNSVVEMIKSDSGYAYIEEFNENSVSVQVNKYEFPSKREPIATIKMENIQPIALNYTEYIMLDVNNNNKQLQREFLNYMTSERCENKETGMIILALKAFGAHMVVVNEPESEDLRRVRFLILNSIYSIKINEDLQKICPALTISEYRRYEMNDILEIAVYNSIGIGKIVDNFSIQRDISDKNFKELDNIVQTVLNNGGWFSSFNIINNYINATVVNIHENDFNSIF